MSKQTLIMGIVSTYPLYYIKPFFTSLQKTKYTGDVVVFVNNIDGETKSFLQENNITHIEYHNNWPYLEDKTLVKWIPKCDENLSPNSLRYLLYNAFLKAHSIKYHMIMISDIRDVYFQKNPFDYPYKKGLSVFLEDTSMTIGTQEHNRYWIENGFGESILKDLYNKTISCSGVTIGTTESMLDYFNNMLAYICVMKNIPGLDQGIHNFLLNKGVLADVNQYADDEGAVSTISQFKHVDKVKIKNGKVIGKDGNIISIVHQYDRNNELLLRWNPRYYIRNSINLLKQRFYFIKVFLNKLSSH